MRRCNIGLFLLAVCLSLPAWARHAPAAPAPGVLIDVPYVRQRRNGCGEASISMLMRYWEEQEREPISRRARPRVIEQALDPHQRGVANTAMVAYLRDSGFRVFAFGGQREDLRENLLKGRPLIVALAPNGDSGPLHYVVVAGMDWKRNFVFINDPAQRKLFRMTWSRFAAQWRITGHWTLLAVPRLPE